VADGGVAQALVEMALRSDSGACFTVVGDPFTFLFSESAARAVVVSDDPTAVVSLAAHHGVACTELGSVTGKSELEFTDLFKVTVDELRRVHDATIPAALA
jgi:phosphoribosylformylglycinamidine synthase